MFWKKRQNQIILFQLKLKLFIKATICKAVLRLFFIWILVIVPFIFCLFHSYVIYVKDKAKGLWVVINMKSNETCQTPVISNWQKHLLWLQILLDAMATQVCLFCYSVAITNFQKLLDIYINMSEKTSNQFFPFKLNNLVCKISLYIMIEIKE